MESEIKGDFNPILHQSYSSFAILKENWKENYTKEEKPGVDCI
jgi:hypothetical protein